MTSDDTPLVIERGNELPARDKHRILIMRVERDLQVKSTHSMQDFGQCHCFKRSQLAPLAHVLCCKGVRTFILHEYSGIMVINHGGKLIGREVGV
jgi:hypothetical protein